MRYIWTIIWSFLLSSMIVYVLASMSGGTFDLTGTIALTAVFALTTIVLGEGILGKSDDTTN